MKKSTKTVKNFQTNSSTAKSIPMQMGNVDSIAFLLQRATYKTPKQTSFQEYLSNARDANREAGNEGTPILVTLPTTRKPVIKIRDNGPGLSPERVETVFVKYGSSTKNNSNLETGGFGIGAKSAWSFTDSFQITSYHEGMKYVYLAHKGNSIAGELTVMNEGEPTKEPNGVEIEIAVEREDVALFISAFYRTTWLWKVKPEIKGLTEECISQIWKDTNWQMEGDGYRAITWERFKNENMGDDTVYGEAEKLFVKAISYKHFANIDGIPYEVAKSGESNGILERELIYIVDFAVGELEIAADRENLVSTDNSDRNSENLPRFDEKLELIKRDLEAKMESVESLSDKITEFETGVDLLNRCSITVNYKGRSYRLSKGAEGTEYNRYRHNSYSSVIELPIANLTSFSWKSDTKKGENTGLVTSIPPSSLTNIVVIDELITKAKADGFHYYGKNRTKLKNYFEWNSHRSTSYFIEPSSQDELDEILSLPLDELGIVKLSDLENPVYKTPTRTKGENVKKKNETSVRLYQGVYDNGKHFSDGLNITDLSEGYLLVCKDSNSPIWPDKMADSTVASMITFFKIYRKLQVVSVKKSVFEELTSEGVQSFTKACSSLKLTKEETTRMTYPDFPCREYAEYEYTSGGGWGRSRSYTGTHRTDNSELDLYLKVKDFCDNQLKKLKNKDLKTFIKTCHDMSYCHEQLLEWSDRQNVRGFLKLNKEYDKTVKEMKETEKAMKSKYPLLDLDVNNNFDTAVVQYVNAIDGGK